MICGTISFVTDAAFTKMVWTSWIAALATAATLFIFDYLSFSETKTGGLAEITARLDELDGLLRDATALDRSLKFDEALSQSDIDDFKDRVSEWSGRVGDYSSKYGGSNVRFYESADLAIARAERTLVGMRARLGSVGSLAENMLTNFSQAEYYRSQARSAESRARGLNSPLGWGRQIDLYLAAEGFYDTARYYLDNARRILTEIGDRRAGIAADVTEERKRLNEARKLSEKLAETSYFEFLNARARNFDLRKEAIAAPISRQQTAFK